MIANKRKALIVCDRQTEYHILISSAYKVGINYSQHPDPRFKLKCCIGDAHSVVDFLCGTVALLLQSM